MEDLAARAIAGDTVAERHLFEKLFVRFRRFAEPTVGSDEAAELAQVACITIYRKYREETFSVSFSAWAYGVFRNVMRKNREQRQKETARVTEFIEALAPPAPVAEQPRLEEFLRACWQWLIGAFPRYARILNLKYQGFETSEVCDRVGLTREQYYVYLGRGRSRLQACLQEKGVTL